MSDPSEFEAQLVALEARMGEAGAMTERFGAELAGLERSLVVTGREVEGLSRSMSLGLRRAFDGVVFDGKRLQDALGQVARSMVGSVFNMAMSPVQNAVGGALAQGMAGVMNALVPFASGGSFAGGRVMPFASGGVVSGPVAFPMRGGTGLMGEAGPEAIMPLARGPDGRLGVRAAGGGGGRPVQVTFNISTPDVAGFERSQAQIAAQMERLMARGQRNR